MKKFVSLLSVVTIFIWILPLGAFIRPSSEKADCGGNRAFCMCAMGLSKIHKDSGTQTISFTNASGVEKTNKSNGSSGNDFINSSNLAKNQDKTSKLVELDLILPKQLFFPVLTPIPKA